MENLSKDEKQKLIDKKLKEQNATLDKKTNKVQITD